MHSSIPASAAYLLKFIYNTDAGAPPPKCYEIIFGNRQNRLPKPITSMTLNELMSNQRNWSSKSWVLANWGIKGAASSASGAAQFMRDTLRGIINEMKLTGEEKFTPDLQDLMAYHLLKRRGYLDYMSGKINRTQFALNLAKEWASFPVLAPVQGRHLTLKRGQSYYAGDSVNKALVSPEKVEQVLATMKAIDDGKISQPDLSKPTDKNNPKSNKPSLITYLLLLLGGFLATIWAWLSALPCNLFGFFCGG